MTWGRRGLAACAVAFVGSLLAVEAHAQSVARAEGDRPPSGRNSGATLVAVVTSEPNSSLSRRVRAELEALGVDVIILRPPAEAQTSREPLERAARNVGAIAAVRLVVSGEGKVEVWVADRATGKAVARELDAPAAGASDATLATGAVELLRASLMELHSSEPPHGDVPVTPKIEALALTAKTAPWVPRLALATSAGAELAAPGLGVSVDGSIGVWARIGGNFGVRFVGRATLAPAHAQTAAGSVDVQSQLAGVMGSYELVDPTGTWVPNLEAGIAVAHVSATGNAELPFQGSTQEAWAAVPLVGVGIAWAFMRGLRLRVEVIGGQAFPTTEVRTPAGPVGKWAEPSVAGTLGIEVMWGS
jgi:hypothetical protein